MVFSGVFVQSKSSTLGLRVQSVVASRTFSYHFTSPAPGRGPRGRHEIEGTGAKLYKRVVNARLAKLILDDGKLHAAVGRSENMVERSCFAAAEEPGQHRGRHAAVDRRVHDR